MIWWPQPSQAFALVEPCPHDKVASTTTRQWQHGGINASHQVGPGGWAGPSRHAARGRQAQAVQAPFSSPFLRSSVGQWPLPYTVFLHSLTEPHLMSYGGATGCVQGVENGCVVADVVALLLCHWPRAGNERRQDCVGERVRVHVTLMSGGSAGCIQKWRTTPAPLCLLHPRPKGSPMPSLTQAAQHTGSTSAPSHHAAPAALTRDVDKAPAPNAARDELSVRARVHALHTNTHGCAHSDTHKRTRTRTNKHGCARE